MVITVYDYLHCIISFFFLVAVIGVIEFVRVMSLLSQF